MDVLKISPSDTLAVALKDLPEGTAIYVDGEEIKLIEKIPAKHKVALKDFKVGDSVVMYGVIVGKAVTYIAKGTCITTQNLKHATQEAVNATQVYSWVPPDVKHYQSLTFKGYHRSDGQVGTANYWLVIPLVFCENRNVELLKEALIDKLGYKVSGDFTLDISSLIEKQLKGASREELLDSEVILTSDKYSTKRFFKNIDGIKFLSHEGGCGGTREDSTTLCQLLAGYINHPNVAGATVLSLGCQNAQVSILRKALSKLNPNFDKPLYVFDQQEEGSEKKMLEQAIKSTFAGLVEANKLERQPAPLNKLTIGLKCGGSDGFSGISANPSIGYTSDMIVALGGKTILAEFPELCGVEQDIINRCIESSDAEKFLTLMKAFEKQVIDSGSSFDMNPSPGNIKDGLITDAMKSAGAARKAGAAPIAGVLNYTEPAVMPGLNLLCTPGNDVEATTGMAGSGAQIILFTTGLGTPTGNPVAQTLKIASNTVLWNKMNDILDVNTGTIISGEESISSKGEEIVEMIIKTASGEYIPKAVGLGQDDFIPWKRAVSL